MPRFSGRSGDRDAVIAMKSPLRLNANLEPSRIRTRFEQYGRVHVPNFFDEKGASMMYDALANETPWQLSMIAGGRHINIDPAQLALMSDSDRNVLVQSANAGARHGFQYMFDNFPVHDLYEQGKFMDHPVMDLYRFLNSDNFLAFARSATGLHDIAIVDAQATLYRPGHFLTAHDDAAAGKHRLAAYVLGFTRHWRVDWGGILQFIDADDFVAEGFTPRFNSLNLLRVPQKHSVSYVTPAASEGRYSVTGWLRSAQRSNR